MRRLGSILMVAFALASCSTVEFENEPQAVQGELSVTLRQDTGVTAVKAADEVPEIGDFIVEVHEKSTGRLFFRKTYADAQGMKIPLNAGEHRLFAYYGDPQKAGFKACYYTADTLFDVLPQQLAQIEAVARLANVKVAVKFGQTLSNDYDQFYAEVVAANGAELRFVKNEKRNGYVPAGDIALNLYVFVQDKWMVYKTAPVTCEARDFLTFNVDTQRLGDLSVEIVIDNGVDTVVKEIEVPAEAAPQEGPSLTVSGFEGNILRICEADVRKYQGYKADIVAMGGVGSCILEIQSSYLASKGIPSSIDLAAVDAKTQDLLNSVGLKFLRNMAGSRLAYVDFSGLFSHIAADVKYDSQNEVSVMDFKLHVTDMVGKTVESQTYTLAMEKAMASVIVNDYDIYARRVLNPSIKVETGDPSRFVLKCVAASDIMNSNIMTFKPASVNGKTVVFETIGGLNPGTGYRLWAVYNENPNNRTSDHTITTETAQQIGNNSFETFTVNTFSGTHTINWVDLWDAYSDPWWATNSSITLDKSNSAAYATYKSFPTVNITSESPYSGYYAITVSSVAVGDVSSEWNLMNSWGDAQVGEVFIGKADNSTEHNGSHIEDGHAFSSRPSSLSYWYKLDCFESDPYYVEIQILDKDGEVIGSAVKKDGASSVSSWTQVTLPINYTVTDRKAAEIYVIFKSSASGKKSSRKYTLSRYDYGEGNVTIHAGNVLWLDEVKLNY